MKNRTTLVLLVLFFGGLLALWLAELARVPTPEEVRRRQARVLPELIDVAPESIARVEIAGGDSTLDFRRHGRAWELVEPLDAPADPSRLDALVNALKSMPRPAGARRLEGSPADYGLDPPVRTIRVFREDSREPVATLEVGKTVGSGRYVRASGGSEVEVVDALPLAGVDRPLHEWRDHTVFRIPGFDVDELEVVGGGRTLRLERDGDRWDLAEPFRAPGDTPRVESLLAGLTSLRVAEGESGFVAEDAKDLGEYGLDPPRWRITLRSGADREGPTDVLLVGDPVPDHPGRYYARPGDRDSLVAIEGRGLEVLTEDPHILRSRRVAVLHPSEVRRIRTESRGVVHEIVRAGEGWRQVEPFEADADPALVHGLIAELNALESFELLDPEKAPNPGLDKPAAVLSVWEGDAEGEPVVRLTLGFRNGAARTLYARAGGDPAVLALPIDALEEPFDDPLAFVEHQIVREAGPSRGLTLVRGDQTFRLVAPPGTPREYNRWTMVEPVRAPVDPEAVGLLDAVVGNVRADRIVERGTPDRSRYGLAKPWASLAQETAPGVQPAPPLIVGDEVPDGGGARYAIVEGRDLVFTLAPSTVGILDAEPHRRQVFEFDAGQVARLVLQTPERTQALVQSPRPFTGGLEWVPERGSDITGLDLASLDLLVGALGRFLTPRFIQYQGPLPEAAGLDAPVLDVTMELRGGLGVRRLRVGAEAGPGTRYATGAEGDEGAVFLLPTDPQLPWAAFLPRAGEPRPGPAESPAATELPANPFADGEPGP